MRKVLFIIALFFTSISFAQLENANWCFGSFAKVDFNTTPPTTFRSAAGTSPVYGGKPVSVSKANGELLFYSDGVQVWDKNNDQMQHGANIGGGVDGVPGLQTAVIVPKPNSPNLYYIFVVNMILNPSSPQNPMYNGGLHYVMVDMNLNGGLGDVVAPPGGSATITALKDHNGNLIDYNYATNNGVQITETRITSTLNCDGTKIWLSFFTRSNSSGSWQRWAYQYLIGDNGINNVPDGTSPAPNTSIQLNDLNFPVVPNWYFSGSTKFSPDGNFLCDANSSNVTVYDFDKKTGVLSFKMNLYPYTSLSTIAGFGVEFSPDSKLLYFSTNDDKIYQNALNQSSKPTIKKFIRIRQKNLFTADSALIVGEFENQPSSSGLTSIIPIPTTGFYGELQAAVDNKIYVCAWYTPTSQWGQLGAILYPNVPGINCQFTANAITLYPGTSHAYSLPQWVHKAVPASVSMPPSCIPVSLTNCNYATNGDFTHAVTYNPLYFNHLDRPFRLNLVPNWYETHGSPQIDDEMTTPVTAPPPGISGYSYMFSTGAGYLGSTTSSGDGIAQKIPPLTVGSNYGLSFFKKFVKTISPNQMDMDKFYVVLMHCSDFSSIKTCDNSIPGFPVNSQVVYCESNMSNINWEQVFLKFTANGNYDMVWVFPKQAQNILYNNGAGKSGVDFTGLEIIKTSNFSAGSTPAPTPPNCNVTIGNLNCGVANAVYTWYRPNNTQYSSSTNPNSQIITNLNAGDPQNVGTWRLEMTVPNAITPTGSCIQLQTPVSATVSVPTCTFPPSTGPWVWMHGDNTTLQPGIYGVQGVASPNNKPGYRTGSSTWTDISGNLWLFGGDRAYFSGGAQWNEQFNDLWMYNISTNQWTWISGDNTPNEVGVYGNQGVASPLNKPGARTSATNWVDNSGNLWLFGGTRSNGTPSQGSSQFNDLWMYSISTNQWTWIKGANVTGQCGNYGTQGTPSVLNNPGARAGAIGWKDQIGNLWLWGGGGDCINTGYHCNDLWKFDISNNSWTWVKGANANTTNLPLGEFGQQGIESVNNLPPPRFGEVYWVDLNGNFWLYGGLVTVYASTPSSGFGDDLWKFNVGTNNWTWVKGHSIPNQTPIYGTLGSPNVTNNPGGRKDGIAWRDPSGDLWLYGGTVVTQPNSGIVASDFWKYEFSNNQWTWKSGSAVPLSSEVNYGTQGVGSPTTYPGQRSYSVSWTGSNGNFWLFGGLSNDFRNDLWKYTGNCTGPNCLTGKSDNSANFLNRPVQNAPVNFFNKKEEVNTSDKPVFSNIQSLEIYNTAGQLLKKVNSDLESYDVLRSNRVSGLMPGLYFIKILYKDKTTKTVKQFMQ